MSRRPGTGEGVRLVGWPGPPRPLLGVLGRDHDLELLRVGWEYKQPVFCPIRHVWRVEVAHDGLGRFGRLAK